MISHIEPVNVSNEELRRVRVSGLARSETRLVTGVRLKLKEYKIRYSGMTEVLICDTPGFEASEGVEVDIANCIGIIKAVCQAKSIRPVVLINYKKIGGRMEGIKTLSSLLIKIFPNIKELLPSFNYIFTNYHSSLIKSINPQCTNILNNLTL